MSEISGAIEFQREVDRILKGIKFRSVTMNDPPFRPGTELPCLVQNYYLRGGGIGDKICYLPALTYLAKNCPWVLGRVWITENLFELFTNVIEQAGNPEWKVLPIEKFYELVEPDTRVRGRGYKDVDGREHMQFTNGTGGHLVSIGFQDCMNRFPPPDGADIYPVIDFDKWSDKKHWTSTDYHPFVVLTTGGISDARTVPGHLWNPIIWHIKSKGLQPVFLGSNFMENIEEKFPVKYPDGCDYGEGIDLRDDTSIMAAAWIMKNAEAVIGLDNGLIQVASCTDANIICAYNIVDPKDRRPKRKAGKWEEIYLSQDELACRGCQSEMPLIAPPHTFLRCLYGDLRCIDLLFANEGQRFKQALDRILV